jgi:hypothetical protein
MHAVELLELLASTTWQTILRAGRNRIAFGEDAITSINLNAIASLNDRSLAIEDTRVDEARKGCDFEIWIGNDRKGWHRYAVQAKKITLSSSRYDQLGHKVRGRTQIDILDVYASGARAAPLYCFYNFATYVTAWNCGQQRDSRQLGCMLVPAIVVREALRIRRGSRNFDWMHRQPEAIAWRCLISCPQGHREQPRAAKWRSRWPDSESYYHKALPDQVQMLRQRRLESPMIDGRFPMHGDERSLAPRWIAIIDAEVGDGTSD